MEPRPTVHSPPCADTFTPIGPELVTADDVGDPGALELELRLNGELRQRAGTRDLIHSVPQLIERYSQVMTLEAGRSDRNRHTGRRRPARPGRRDRARDQPRRPAADAGGRAC